MNRTTWTRRLGAAVVLALALTIGLGACSSSGKASADKASAKAAASSLKAQPQVSSDLNASEQLLLTNLQHNFQAAHPFKSVDAAVRATFPQGDTKAIVQYAESTFTLAVLHTKGPGSARDVWLQGVFNEAEKQGGGTPASPAVPGIPTPSASGSH